jgi:hypothetical protein
MKHWLGGRLDWEDDDDVVDGGVDVAVVWGRIVNWVSPCAEEYPALPADA